MQKFKSIVYLLFVGMLLTIQWSCKNDMSKDVNPPGSSDHLPQETWTPWIAISNTADKTLEIYNYDSTAWSSTTRKWLFKPTTALGYSSGAVIALGDGIGDARMHYTDGFPNKAQSAFVVQGGRWLGIGAYIPLGSYVKGQKLWEYTFSSSENPNNHAVELLPDGNIAVAGFGDGAATSLNGNWIRIYNTSDPTGSSYVQTTILCPHALVMDTVYHRLWAGGQILINGLSYHGIFAYIIAGTRTNPTITEDTNFRSVLRYGNPTYPTGIPDHLKFPHDLAADYDDDNKLIYGDHTGVYIFNKVTKTFVSTPGASHLYSGIDVQIKSVGKQAGGKYISTNAYSPSSQYGTNKVDFFDPVSGVFSFSRFVTDFTIYRARIWTHVYQ